MRRQRSRGVVAAVSLLCLLCALAAPPACAVRGERWERNVKLFETPPLKKFGGSWRIKVGVESMRGEFDGKPVDETATEVESEGWEATWLFNPAEMSREQGKIANELSASLVQIGHGWSIPRNGPWGSAFDGCEVEFDVATIKGSLDDAVNDPDKWEFTALKAGANCAYDATKRFMQFMKAGKRDTMAIKLVVELSYEPDASTLLEIGRQGNAAKDLAKAGKAATEAQGELVKALDKAIELEKAAKAAPGDRAAKAAYERSLKDVNKARKKAEKAAGALRKQTKAYDKIKAKVTKQLAKAEDAYKAAEAALSTNSARRKLALKTMQRNPVGSEPHRLAKANLEKLSKEADGLAKKVTKKRKLLQEATELFARGGARAKNLVGRIVGKVASKAGAKLLGRLLVKLVPGLNLIGLAVDIYDIAKIIYYWDSVKFGWFDGASGEPSKMKRDPAPEVDPEQIGDDMLGDKPAPDIKGPGAGGGEEGDEDDKATEEGNGSEGGDGGRGGGDAGGDDGGDEGGTEHKRPEGGVRPARPGENPETADDGGPLYTEQLPADSPCTGKGGRCQRTRLPCYGGWYDLSDSALCMGQPSLLGDRKCCRPYEEKTCAHVKGTCAASASECAAMGEHHSAAADWWQCPSPDKPVCCAAASATAPPSADYSRTFSRDRMCQRQGGVCQKDTVRCEGRYESRLCGGSGAISDRRCCLPPGGGAKYTQTYWKDRQCKAAGGTCKFTGLACPGGEYKGGKCGGPPERACCVGSTASGNKSGGEGGGEGGGIGEGKGAGTVESGKKKEDEGGAAGGAGAGKSEVDGEGGTKSGSGVSRKGDEAGTEKRRQEGEDEGAATTPSPPAGGGEDFCGQLGGRCVASASECAAPLVTRSADYYCFGKTPCCLAPLDDEEAGDEADAADREEKSGQPEEYPAGQCPPGRSLCVLTWDSLVRCSNGVVEYDEAKVQALKQLKQFPDGTSLEVIDVDLAPMKPVHGKLSTGGGSVTVMAAVIEWRLASTGSEYTGTMAVGETHREKGDIFWVDPSTCRGERIEPGLNIDELKSCLREDADAIVLNPSCEEPIDMGLVSVRLRKPVRIPFFASEESYVGSLGIEVVAVHNPQHHGIVLHGKLYHMKNGLEIEMPVRKKRDTNVAE